MDIKNAKADSILLVWLGKIGDFVVSTPFIKAVRRKYPDSHIAVMVRPPVDKVAVLVEDVDEVLVFPKGAKSFKGLPKLAAKYMFRKWDMCIDMNPSYSGSSGRITVFSRARYKVGFANPRAVKYYTHTVAGAGNDEHMMIRYARLAEYLGLEFDRKMVLSLRDGDVEKADAVLKSIGFDGKFIVMHPGNFKKEYSCWPKDNFISLSRDAAEKYPEYRQVYLSGPGEEGEVAEMVSKLGGIAVTAPPMPLPVTAAFLHKASIAVVNSTGTLHMAEAVGTPTLSFHKTYSYLCWRPLDTKGAALDSGDWNTVRNLPYEDGLEAFVKIMDSMRTASA